MILKNKKKIRVIIGSLNVGGTEKQLLEIINHLVEKKWEIELITLKEKGNLAEDLNPKIKVNNLNIKSSFKVIRLCLIVLKLFKIFKKDPNTLTHFFLPQAYIVGMIAAMTARSKCKLIMSRRSLNLYQKNFPLSKTIEKFLHKKVDKILVNSKAVKNQLINKENVSKNKIKIIYNGVDARYRKRDDRKYGKSSIIMIANLIPYKNHRMVLYALNIIKEKLPKDWFIYFIGRDDGIRKDLVSLAEKLEIRKNTLFIHTEDIHSILPDMSMGILCSEEESFPNAILEYFSHKVPVISSDVGGCKEIVKNKKNGILLKENSDLELSKAILYLYKNKKIAKKFGTEGFKIIKKKFTLNKMINEHEREYLEHVNP